MMEHTSVSWHFLFDWLLLLSAFFHPFRPFPVDDKDQTKQLESSGKDRDMFRAQTDTDGREIRRTQRTLSVMNYYLSWRRDCVGLGGHPRTC
jgi:hypothetical protein